MPVRQRLSTTEQGRAVVVKHADPGPDADRLAAEADLLRSAAHPGVVELLAQRRLPDGAHEAMLVLAGSRTAADLRPGVIGVARLVAALATTVADLHDLGIAHRRISIDHVVLDGENRPLLCGFGAGLRAEPGALPPDAVAADVAGLGSLLRRLLLIDAEHEGHDGPDGQGTDWEPIPRRRLRRPDRWTGYARRALLNVADQATADDPAHRPSARRFAQAVLAALPEARLPGAAGGDDEEPAPSDSPWPRRRFAPRRRARRLVLAAAAVAVGFVVFGSGSLLRPPRGGSPIALPARAAGPGTGPTTAPTTTTSPPVTTSTTSATSTSTNSTSTNSTTSSTSAPALTVAADGTVEVDGVRYGLGAPGDFVSVGDWDCDGAATAALVRRASGEVFVFDTWATSGGDAVARMVRIVARPVAASAVVTEGACDVLLVTAADGTVTEVRS